MVDFRSQAVARRLALGLSRPERPLNSRPDCSGAVDFGLLLNMGILCIRADYTSTSPERPEMRWSQ